VVPSLLTHVHCSNFNPAIFNPFAVQKEDHPRPFYERPRICCGATRLPSFLSRTPFLSPIWNPIFVSSSIPTNLTKPSTRPDLIPKSVNPSQSLSPFPPGYELPRFYLKIIDFIMEAAFFRCCAFYPFSFWHRSSYEERPPPRRPALEVICISPNGFS